MMECPECNAEMIYDGPYGYFAAHQSGEKSGDIYKCPNREGFEDMKEADSYWQDNPEMEFDDLEEACCSSSVHNGFYYTDKQGNLREGYPC